MTTFADIEIPGSQPSNLLFSDETIIALATAIANDTQNFQNTVWNVSAFREILLMRNNLYEIVVSEAEEETINQKLTFLERELANNGWALFAEFWNPRDEFRLHLGYASRRMFEIVEQYGYETGNGYGKIEDADLVYDIVKTIIGLSTANLIRQLGFQTFSWG